MFKRGQHRNSGEKERDIRVITKYYLQGYSYRRIAEKVAENAGNGYKITIPTVYNEVKKLHSDWASDRIDQIHHAKVRELQKIDKVESTAWEAWERSCEDKIETTTRRKIGKGTGVVIEKQIYNYGEARYLQIVAQCIDRRCKILGIDAPKKFEHSGKSFLDFLKEASE
jgi:transposase